MKLIWTRIAYVNNINHFLLEIACLSEVEYIYI